MNPKIRLSDVEFHYPSLSNRFSLIWKNRIPKASFVFKGLNLAVQQNESLGLVGDNGSGKTTLLRIMAGIFEPSRGEIFVSGRVSTMFDSGFGLDLESDGPSNVKLRGLLLGKKTAEIKYAITDVEEFVRLGQKWREPIKTYSAGMVSRMVVGLSTCFNTDILLMDEAIGAADLAFQVKANERFMNLLKNSGTIVMASHNQDLMEEFCNKAILLKEGEVIAEGQVEEIWKIHRKNNRTL
jgi:ABC-type polysaccharide/polyol phosphate transport system ATPase subunit